MRILVLGFVALAGFAIGSACGTGGAEQPGGTDTGTSAGGADCTSGTDLCNCNGGVCTPTCVDPQGGCKHDCEGASDCTSDCPGGGCQTTCTEGSDCQQICDGGMCQMWCTGAAECHQTCEGGGCQVTCTDTETCVLDCPGGGCNLTCLGGVESCRIEGCDDTCALACGGAPDCQNSCSPLDGGCVTLP